MTDKKEVEIDFGRIFSIFKKKGKKNTDSNFNLGRLSFVTQPWVLVTLLILIPFVFSFGLRMVPAYLPLTDDWAEDAVLRNIQNTLAAEINGQHPNLPATQKQALLQESVDQMLKENKADIDASIKQTSEYFRSRLQNENNYTYLLAIDPYTYVRKARNILETGNYYDKLNEGVPWDDHMIAPIGSSMGFNLHQYIIAINHRILSFFGFKDLIGTAFFVPIFFSALAVIPAFFLGKRFAGNTGGFVSAMIVAVASPFLSRTAGGFVDTDAYAVFFPLLISWLFIEAMERKPLISKIIYASLAAVALTVFSYIWEWWFIFNLLLAVIVGFYGFNLLRSFITKKSFKLDKPIIRNLYSSATFVGVSVLLIGLLKGFKTAILNPILYPLEYFNYKAVATVKIWPNVMTTVAEQNALSASKVVSMMGGQLLFITALIGLYFIAFNFKKLTKQDIYQLIGGSAWLFVFTIFMQPTSAVIFDILVLVPFVARYLFLLKGNSEVSIEFSILTLTWFLITFFASVRGVRFTLLLVPVIALGFGVAIGKLSMLLQKSFSKSFDLDIRWAKAVTAVAIMLILVPPIRSGYNTAVHELPSMNDAWYESLTKIKEESSPDAIINSWWDFGHWFKAIGDRAVTFDGASQNTPMAHWIGLSLMSNYENLTVGILRMLDCGSNTAFEVLDKELNDEPKSVKILYDIVAGDKTRAKEILKEKGITDATATEVVKYTHCSPPENYYIVSDDMVGKAGVWAHFGAWDFDKANMYREVSKRSKEEAIAFLEEEYSFEYNDAMRIYYEIESTPANDWIAPWPSYASKPTGCVIQTDETMVCPLVAGNNQLPFIINITNMESYIETAEGKVYPEVLTFPSGEGFGVKSFEGESINLGLNLIASGEGYSAILVEPVIALSTFNKLFYHKAHGLKCFELFDSKTQVSGGKIYVYKVDWSCSQ